jgi:hypothetical protein
MLLRHAEAFSRYPADTCQSSLHLHHGASRFWKTVPHRAAPCVEQSLGSVYRHLLAMMRAYQERIIAFPADFESGARTVRLLAVLGPRLIVLSGEHADGARPYPRGHVSLARSSVPARWSMRSI